MEPADLEEIVRLYGLRNWVEQSYKQAKQELGWADFQVRQDRAIRRHWEWVCCAFAFCWWARSHGPAEPIGAPEGVLWLSREADEQRPEPAREPEADLAAGEKSGAPYSPSTAGTSGSGTGFLAGGAAAGPGLAHPVAFALALLASVERLAPAARTPGLARYCG